MIDTLLKASQELFLEAMQIGLSTSQRASLVSDIDSIDGVLPCLAGLAPRKFREQRGQSVASAVQILRPLRGLFQHAGQLLCPTCGRPAQASSTEELVDEVLTEQLGERLVVLARLDDASSFESLREAGVIRVALDGELFRLDEVSEDAWSAATLRSSVIDRIRVKTEGKPRLRESIARAFSSGSGVITLSLEKGDHSYSRDPWCSACEKTIAPADATVFDLGKPASQCGTCQGSGISQKLIESRLVEDGSLSILEGAMPCLLERAFKDIESEVLRFCKGAKIPADKPWEALSSAQTRQIWSGDSSHGFPGLTQLLTHRYTANPSLRTLQSLEVYFEEEPCFSCDGTGLSDVLQTYHLGGYSLFEWLKRPITEVLSSVENELAHGLEPRSNTLREALRTRLRALVDLGLGHLELRRRLDSMSLGERQRTLLVPMFSSRLTGLLIVFDEPTTSLHPSEIDPLWRRIEDLRDAGNTVVLIEHNRRLWPRADWLLELGPRAGEFGGELLWEGPGKDVSSRKSEAEASAFSGHEVRDDRLLKLEHPGLRNVEALSLEVPLGCVVGVSGVSGSGKSTLIVDMLGEALLRNDGNVSGEIPETVRVVRDVISGHRYSTPATFTGILDPIRKWFAGLPESKLRGLTAAHFSYRRREGRCEVCGGSGLENDELERYRVVSRSCRVCDGTRYGNHIVSARYKGFTIADVLNMSVQEAYELFEKNRRIADILEHFIRLGLDYLPLGLSTDSLSFGERQRLTLIRALAKPASASTLYLFDEPGRGLHDEDIRHLIHGFMLLKEQGHSVVVVEHHRGILSRCDWHLVMGPGPGSDGGRVIYSGKSWDEACSLQP